MYKWYVKVRDHGESHEVVVMSDSADEAKSQVKLVFGNDVEIISVS